MESLTRLVTESLVRHGFDRPLDYRRLHWSRWFRCESPHSLLAVPSKPGVFAIAEEITDFGKSHVGTAAPGCPAERSSAASPDGPAAAPRRLLAVIQFFDTDDMAFTLDRMLTRANPMRARLASGRYFVRFVAIEDETQRRSIAAALNQWISNTGEKASAIGAHFASSLELTDAHVGTAALGCPAEQSSAAPQAYVGADAFVRPARAASMNSDATEAAMVSPDAAAPLLDSGAASNIHCPSPLPSGF